MNNYDEINAALDAHEAMLSETWIPTLDLRWKAQEIGTNIATINNGYVLQQMHTSLNGKTKWENIKIITE